MPNHVKNRVTAPPSVLCKLISENDEGAKIIDFNGVIRQPKAIVTDSISCLVKDAAQIALGLINFNQRPGWQEELSAGDMNAVSDKLHLSNCTKQLLEGPMPKDFSDKDFESFMGCLRAYRDCGGLMDWWDWNIKMWGTKWNAYGNMQVNETYITFRTAWNPPHPVMERLNEITKEDFKHEWANEDTGRGVGVRQYSKDVGFKENVYDEMREGYELAFDLWPGLSEEFEFDGISYNYKS